MWTEEHLKEIIIRNNSFYFRDTLTELLPLALSITEDAQKIPYAYTWVNPEKIDGVEIAKFSPERLSDKLTVQNYHAMLKFLHEQLFNQPESIESQKSKGFKLTINFENNGRPTRDISSLFQIWTFIQGETYGLYLSSKCEGYHYNALSCLDRTDMQKRCEDFLGPNRKR